MNIAAVPPGAGGQSSRAGRSGSPSAGRAAENERLAELAGTHKTVQGTEVTVTGSGEDFKIDGKASVICGNVQTANATVYIIDSVLMPKS